MATDYYYNDELNSIIESFFSEVKHSYLQKYLEDPLIDEDQATFLYLMLKDKTLDSSYISHCIVTTTLVQAALDTHELVTVNNLENDTLKKKRQLTVLAGDYYSSLYYFILSTVNDVSLMRVLAKSIQEINESKMNVYIGQEAKEDSFIHDIKVIDSILLRNIADLFQLTEWKEIVDEFFFYKRLLKERFLWIHSGIKGSISDYLLRKMESTKHSFNQEERLVQQFGQYIEASRQKLLSLSRDRKGLNSYFLTRIDSLLQENHYDEQRVMEEG
ncbi:heptaprenyl diphosphate synthase component 1 [Evansella sp. AB-P1]|uniref:heptaprenyl diphosphate synthase component 1 n=1 Tax=Evansella sp. AB-P1 TaxID=3037653 RepID=UPI00241E8205|nr:heptaprenyl diphosphate synthase component 1 [Evansella sp. AB-P1]MDG5787604.1 heptaprenyl diphosphate synthase component 1 [Evansella sp. AB-P1]